MLSLLIACSIILGVLGSAMTIFSIYLIRTNSKLEATIKDKNHIIEEKDERLKEKDKFLKEQEGFVVLLREQVRARDRQIQSLKRKPSYMGK